MNTIIDDILTQSLEAPIDDGDGQTLREYLQANDMQRVIGLIDAGKREEAAELAEKLANF